MMDRRSNTLASFAIGIALTLSSCRRGPAVSARIEQPDDERVVFVASHEEGASISFPSHPTCVPRLQTPILWETKCELRAATLPAGKQELTVRASKDGQTNTTTLDFERKPVPAKMEMKAQEGLVECACAGSLCSSLDTVGVSLDGKLGLRLFGDPGTRIELNGRPAKIEALPISVQHDLSIASLQGVFQPNDGPKPRLIGAAVFSIDGIRREGTLGFHPACIRDAVARRLERIVEGPVRLTGESDDPKPTPGAMIWLQYDLDLVADMTKRGINWNRKAMRLGSGQRLDDIERIAITRRGSRKTGQCGPYVLDSGTGLQPRAGGGSAYVRGVFTSAITIYERRTGRVLGRRTFVGSNPSCPATIERTLGAGSSKSSFYGEPDEKTIVAWLESFGR